MSLPVELLRKHDVPFQWGVSDCVQWAGAAVEFFSGRDPVSHYRYSTEEEARAIIAASGSLEALVTREIGEPRARCSEAALGDVVLSVFRETGPILGVADPPVFWLRAPAGYIPVEMTLALRVWPCRKP